MEKPRFLEAFCEKLDQNYSKTTKIATTITTINNPTITFSIVFTDSPFQRTR